MSTEATPVRPPDNRSYWQQQYDEATPGSMEQWRASAMGCMEAMGNCVTRATNAERDARHWREECGKVHAKADIMEDRWRTAESKLAAARAVMEEVVYTIEGAPRGSVGSINNIIMPHIGVDQFERWKSALRESGAGREAPPTVEEVVQRTSDWLLSDEGKKAVADALAKAALASESLRRAQRVDPAILREPIGSEPPPTEAMAKCPTCANLHPDQRRFASCGCGKGDDMEAAAREFYTRGDMMLTPIQALAAFAAQQTAELRAEVERLRKEKVFADEALKALKEITGSDNRENPWLGVCARVALMQMELAARFTADEIEGWLLAYHSQPSNDRVGMTQFIRTKIKERVALALGQEGGA